MTLVARNESKHHVTMPRGKSLRWKSYEDTLREMEAYLDGKIDNAQSGEDAYADITEPTNTSGIRLPDSEDPDATENSSSFGDTVSRSEVGSGTSDGEVESEYRVDNGFGLDSYGSVFPMRKKKLTTHWRSFIRPVMWRCKWAELKIKELESRVQKYNRELEANDQTKLMEVHEYTSDFCSKSYPYSSHSVKRKVMKRRKRKLVENVADISTYMSQHHIYSYIENKKSDPDGIPYADDAGDLEVYSKNDEFGVDDDWLKDGEDSLEQIFRQIETVQSQVHRLRNHLDMVMLKNGVKFSSSENLSLLTPYDAQNSVAHSPDFSVGNGDNLSIGAIYVPPNLSDFEVEDLDLPDVPDDVDGTQIPDIIESTVGLLSATDVTIHQPQIVESGENLLDDTLIHDKVLQNRNMSCGVIDDQSTHGYQELENKKQKLSILPAGTGLVPDPMIGDALAQGQSTVTSCLSSEVQVLRLKRKRGERKAGPGGWNLKCPGEPDSN